MFYVLLAVIRTSLWKPEVIWSVNKYAVDSSATYFFLEVQSC